MAHSEREPVEFVPEDFVYFVTKELTIHKQSNKKLSDRQLNNYYWPLNVGPETEDAEGEEYIVEKISDVKLAPFGRKRGL